MPTMPDSHTEPADPTLPDAPAARRLYVGYLDLPTPYRRFLQVCIPAALLLVGLGAAGLAATRTPWGGGVWHTAAAQEWTGRLVLRPYPMLVVEGADAGAQDAGPVGYLLVTPGKHGAEAVATPLGGQRVVVRGYAIERDGRRLIELLPGSEGLEAAAAASTPETSTADANAAEATAMESGPTLTLVGEMMDSKCYLGAMKPGRGRGHKACATLCVQGGIPPMLVTRRDDGGADYLILTDAAGGPLTGDALARLLPLIAEPVRVTGRVTEEAGWRRLALADNAVQPVR